MPALRVVTIVFAFCLAAPAGAATFVANNLSDLNDNNPGDGVCNVGDGSCSFRAAAQEANALPGPDVIELGAGTHVLSQTYNCGGPTCGLFVEIRPEVEVVGQGVGTTFVHGADISYGGAVIQANVVGGASGPMRFADMSMDPGTFAGFGGDMANQMIGLLNANCPTCTTTIERVQLDVFHASDAGGSSPLGLIGGGRAVVRDTTINVSGGANPGPSVIDINSMEVLVEDLVINGGNSPAIGIAYRINNCGSCGTNTLTVRGSRFAGVGGSGGAAIFFTNINIPTTLQAIIEDNVFDGVGRGVNLRNWGTLPGTAQITIERNLFTGVSGEALRLSGPCEATLRNSTISSATTGVALIAPENGGTGTCDVTLDSSTIAGGTTSVAVGSGLGTVAARNSILADAATAACTGTLDSLGHNLIEGSCTVAGDTTGNITGMDPMLAALADNGGPTQTRALLAGSPAIDAGDAGNCPALDQRGLSRPADGDGDMTAACDIGAFEKDAVAPPSNDPPQAQDDAADVDEDGSASIDVAGNDSDPDGNIDPATATIACGGCSGPGNGALSANGDGSFDYTPAADYFGPDGFTYEICDSEGLCDTATVSINVVPVNDAPDFVPGPGQVFAGGASGAQSAAGWATMIDLGPGEAGQSVQAFEVSLVEDPDGVVSGLPTIDASGGLGYTLSGASGTASFAVVLRDDGGTANGGVDASATMGLHIAVGASADLAVVIEQCTTQAPPGELYRYAMRIDQLGPDTALDIVLDAPIPAGASIVALGNGNCMDAGDSVACHFAQRIPGASIAVPVVLSMPGGGPVDLDLEASVSAATDDANAGNDGAAATVSLVPGLILDSGFESCNGEGG